MTTTSLVSSSCFNRSLLPPHNLPHPQQLNNPSSYASSSAANAQLLRTDRTKLRISNFHRLGAVGRDLEAVGVPTSVPVRVALELLQAGHRYLDVRTPEEFSAGHASGAINVPYMYRLGSGMSKNPNFVKEVALHFRKDDEIIVGCQSGKRSLMAASDLLATGFTGITDIAGGYAAWIQNGLPSES